MVLFTAVIKSFKIKPTAAYCFWYTLKQSKLGSWTQKQFKLFLVVAVEAGFLELNF